MNQWRSVGPFFLTCSSKVLRPGRRTACEVVRRQRIALGAITHRPRPPVRHYVLETGLRRHEQVDVVLGYRRALGMRAVHVAGIRHGVYALRVRERVREGVLDAAVSNSSIKGAGRRRTVSFADKASFRVSSSVHFLQMSFVLSLDRVQLRRDRWTRVAWCASTRFLTKGSASATLSDSLSESDFRGHDHIFVRLINVVHSVGVEFAGLGAHWVSMARCRSIGRGATTAGVERDDDSWKRRFSCVREFGWQNYIHSS